MKKIFTANEFDKKGSQKHIIFLCDHASNWIPASYKNLGLSVKALNSHISYLLSFSTMLIYSQDKTYPSSDHELIYLVHH